MQYPAILDTRRVQGQVAPRGSVRGILPAVALLLVAAGAGADEPSRPPGWQCATAVATAYRFNPARQRWQTLVLSVAGQSFRLRPGTATPWELVWTGGDGSVFACTGAADGAGGLRCGGEQLFTFDAATRAFSSRVFGPDNGNLGAELQAATITGECTPAAPAAAR
jgi:urease beta subunit